MCVLQNSHGNHHEQGIIPDPNFPNRSSGRHTPQIDATLELKVGAASNLQLKQCNI